MQRFGNISLKNKIFFSTFGVVLLLAVGIALDTHFVVVSGLTDELEQRGIAIAQSIADRSKTHIVTRDQANLVSLVFDSALLEERRKLIAYIFILDTDHRVLSHTFLHPFPEELRLANVLLPEHSSQIKLLHFSEQSAFDIAVPIWEGIYQIGSVHVGLNKRHIDRLIGKLRITYFGIIAAILLIFFLISHWLSAYITKPISELTKIADEISRGNLDVASRIGSNIKCWEKMGCEKEDCPAYHFSKFPCWYMDDTLCSTAPPCKFPDKLQHCLECPLYHKRGKDEVQQLADSFLHMTHRLKASQEELRESEKKYRSLFESGPNPVFIVQPRTLVILDANPAAETTYGYSRDEIIGKSFSDLGISESEGSPLSPFWVTSFEDSRFMDSRVRHYKKGSKPLYVNLHTCAIKFGPEDAIIVAVTDITDMVEKDAQLIQASKMTTLGEMSAGIAHELNQPLNVIKMGSEFLTLMMEQKKNITEEDAFLVVGEISSQVDRASEIIRHLRQFGRKSDLVKEKVDINQVVRDVLAIMERQLKLQGIDITVDMQDGLASIDGYKNRIEQVIFNLLTNARDAIIQKKDQTAPRAISVRSFAEEGSVVLTIADTGVGIPEALQDKIFEPFFTTKEVGKGMGLGLSITYGIIKDSNGQISVDSKENQGSSFKLVFSVSGSKG